ncbi:hypothetical protein BH18THE1_BH18THE1_22520 [soil metagenome]
MAVFALCDLTSIYLKSEWIYSVLNNMTDSGSRVTLLNQKNNSTLHTDPPIKEHVIPEIDKHLELHSINVQIVRFFGAY